MARLQNKSSWLAMVRSRWHAYGRPYPGHGTGRRLRMSDQGQNRKSKTALPPSALPSTADIRATACDVRKVPATDNLCSLPYLPTSPLSMTMDLSVVSEGSRPWPEKHLDTSAAYRITTTKTWDLCCLP